MKTTTRATVLALLITTATACGSSDGVADQVEGASDSVEQAADDIDQRTSDLATTLSENGLTSIASALEAIDLSQLTDTEEYTFLAPSDEAFQAVDPDQIASLLSDPGAVADLLRNHMVNERLTAEQIADLSSVETAAGNTLDVSVDGDTVMVGDATVSSTDIEVGNGMVHVVDRLFLP